MSRPGVEPNPNPPGPRRRGVWTSPWLLPPAWFLPFNALLLLLDRRWPVTQVIEVPWSYLGWLPIVVGVALCAAAAWQFHRHRTDIRPFHDSSTLLTTGVFAWSRNPIYLGMVLAMIGVAVNAGSLSVWLVPPLFAAALWAWFIRAEERMLRHRFGAAYDAYRQRVRRWL